MGKQSNPYRAAVKGAGAAQEEGEEGEFAAHFHHEGDQEIGVNPGRADADTEEDVYAAWYAEFWVRVRGYGLGIGLGLGLALGLGLGTSLALALALVLALALSRSEEGRA